MNSTSSLSPDDRELIATVAARTVELLETEYPNAIRLDLRGPPERPITPSALHPAFYGCYDWHSAVHSTWQVVRAARVIPDAPFVDAAIGVLDRLLTLGNLSFELAWATERPTFEMPYGMAWLLTLHRELAVWQHDRAATWAAAVQPLADHATQQFTRYCTIMRGPVRGGLHSQSAFSLSLAWDAVAPGSDLRQLIASAARRFYGDDERVDARLEPSASDFLSPSLAAADLMQRVLEPDEFVEWFDLYRSASLLALEPVVVVDPSDGQLAHWAGLNLSRSWMMHSIGSALPEHHAARQPLLANARAHARAGRLTAAHDDYMVSHWVPSFAVYLLAN